MLGKVRFVPVKVKESFDGDYIEYKSGWDLLSKTHLVIACLDKINDLNGKFNGILY